MQLFPVKNIRIIVNRPEKEVLEELMQRLSGRLYMKKDGMFGERECEYTAMYNYDYFVVEEAYEGWGGIIPAPSMEMRVFEQEKNSCVLHCLIKLSILWKLLIVSFFLIVLAINLYYYFKLGISRDALVISLKSLAGIVVFYLFIAWGNFRSVDSFKQFLKQLN